MVILPVAAFPPEARKTDGGTRPALLGSASRGQSQETDFDSVPIGQQKARRRRGKGGAL
jgi:hypothetical protein